MRIVDINTLRKLFLELLDESKYSLINEGFSDTSDIKFGEDINDDYHEKIFLEYGFYNEEIEQVPQTAQVLLTPGIFAYDGADIINNPTYDAYNVMVALEFLGFEIQREQFRRLLERYVADIRGKAFILYETEVGKYFYDLSSNPQVPSSYIAAYTCVISAEMPVLSDTITQSGYDRFESYVNLDLSVISLNVEISKEDDILVDGDSLSLTDIVFQRDKISKGFNVRNKEVESYPENQTITISINGIINNTTASNKIKRAILSKNYLNEKFTITYSGYSYDVFLKTGNLQIKPNAPIEFTAAFSTLKEI